MRTTIDISEDLLEKAKKVLNVRTKKEAIDRSLNEILFRKYLEEIKSLVGKVKFNIKASKIRKLSERRYDSG